MQNWNNIRGEELEKNSFLRDETLNLVCQVVSVEDGTRDNYFYTDVFFGVNKGIHKGKILKDRFFNTEDSVDRNGEDRKGGKWKMVWLASKCGCAIKDADGVSIIPSNFTSGDLVGKIVCLDFIKKRNSDFFMTTKFRSISDIDDIVAKDEANAKNSTDQFPKELLNQAPKRNEISI